MKGLFNLLLEKDSQESDINLNISFSVHGRDLKKYEENFNYLILDFEYDKKKYIREYLYLSVNRVNTKLYISNIEVENLYNKFEEVLNKINMFSSKFTIELALAVKVFKLVQKGKHRVNFK